MRLELHTPRATSLDERPDDYPAENGAAVESNRAVGIAIGIGMQRFAMSEGHALAFLKTVSENSHIRLETLAEQMVAAANLEAQSD